MHERRSVCVMGLGYIGLPTASLLATKGYEVTGVDVEQSVVDTINQGRIHISEPDLDILVRSAVNSRRLVAASAPVPADVFILAVPTPFKDGHVPDLRFVEAAARTVAQELRDGDLVILESTSPVGTTERVAGWIADEIGAARAERVHYAHCPERVLPGSILRELVENDRIVGGLDAEATRVAAEFYEEFVSGAVLRTNSRAAELAKLAENTFRDVNIALANELSLICDDLEINPWEVISLANKHPRVNILSPGPGVGGHCIAVDPWFVVDAAPSRARLIRTAREVNDGKPEQVVARVLEAVEASGRERPLVACLGLAYKADIDDLRESPAVRICARLAESGKARVAAVEPYIGALPASLEAAGVEMMDLDRVLEKADILVGLVDHAQFRALPASVLHGRTVIDTRGMWSAPARAGSHA